MSVKVANVVYIVFRDLKLNGSLTILHGNMEIAGEYASEEEIVTETKINRSVVEKPLMTCDVCNFKTKLMSSLSRHKRTHNREKITCVQCPGKTFQTNYDLKLHEKHRHGDGAMCDHCSKVFKS